MIEIFRGTFFEVMNIKNLLENENISSFIQNENMSSIIPSDVTSGGVAAAFLKINTEDFIKVKKILEDRENGCFDMEG